MSTTTDPDDPRLGHGTDEAPIPQHDTYLVLSEDERAKGFVRPVRRSYRHVGRPGPRYPLRDLTQQEKGFYSGAGYVKYEEYPKGEGALGRFWSRMDLESIDRGCGTVTTMSQDIAETYARNPHFYGATYCCGCRMHLRVGDQGEFTWMEGERDTDVRVGT